jgi:hypothetical protein
MTHLAAINYKESTLATKFRQYNITALSGYIDPIDPWWIELSENQKLFSYIAGADSVITRYKKSFQTAPTPSYYSFPT